MSAEPHDISLTKRDEALLAALETSDTPPARYRIWVWLSIGLGMLTALLSILDMIVRHDSSLTLPTAFVGGSGMVGAGCLQLERFRYQKIIKHLLSRDSDPPQFPDNRAAGS